MEKIPFISIVIPTTGNVKFIKGLVESVNRLDYPKDKYELISGPLHIISFLPKGMNKNESDEWTLNKRMSLMKSNFMLSRPLFKNRYFLRAVLGNYNTGETHINELLKLLD